MTTPPLARMFVAVLVTETRVPAADGTHEWRVLARRVMGLYRAPGYARSAITRHLNGYGYGWTDNQDLRRSGTVRMVDLDSCLIVHDDGVAPEDLLADAERVIDTGARAAVDARAAIEKRAAWDQQRAINKVKRKRAP